jgi:hypothetical protein
VVITAIWAATAWYVKIVHARPARGSATPAPVRTPGRENNSS